jgi:D-alanyl-D-alanine carboxypeptidase
MIQKQDRRSFVASMACAICAPVLGGSAEQAQTTDDSGSRSAAREALVSGVVAIARGGRIVREVATGLADRESRRTMKPASRFQIGSVSKWFTALLVLRLVEHGRLDLRSPIGDYLDRYPTAVGSRVRLVDLLSNTSGIRDRLPTAFINRPDVAASALTAAEAVRSYALGPLDFAPGTQFDYSHTNWLIVQAIVERAGGMSIERLLADLVLNPMGLGSTGVSHGSFETVRDHAIAYAGEEPTAPRELHVIPRFLVPTGTIFSDARDLLSAAHQVYNGSFLGASARTELSTVRYAGEDYALGGRVRRRDIAGAARTMAFEVGSFGGFKALLIHLPEADTGVVALNNTNMDEDALSELAISFLDAFLRSGGS